MSTIDKADKYINDNRIADLYTLNISLLKDGNIVLRTVRRAAILTSVIERAYGAEAACRLTDFFSRLDAAVNDAFSPFLNELGGIIHNDDVNKSFDIIIKGERSDSTKTTLG